VVTAEETLFTIPCEAIFNAHPGVSRSALVGVGPAGAQQPVICIEPSPEGRRMPRKVLRAELLDLAATHAHTHLIQTVLFHRKFPVDIRHNSKIFREKLAVWAAGRLGRHGRQQIAPTDAATVEAVSPREDGETALAETVSTGDRAIPPREDGVSTPKEMAITPEDGITTKKYRMTFPEDADESTR
jgi:acyl-CoA synthetase (AMP-forming)/AMP-acid ligase II